MLEYLIAGMLKSQIGFSEYLVETMPISSRLERHYKLSPINSEAPCGQVNRRRPLLKKLVKPFVDAYQWIDDWAFAG